MSNYENKGGRPSKRGKSPFTGIFCSLIKDATQQEVANKIGVSRQNIGKWLSGSTTPDIDTLCKIADAYNVSTDYLLGRTPYPTVDQDLRIAEEVTGLSEQSINALCLLKQTNSEINPNPYLSVLSIVDFLLNNLIDDSSSNDHIPNPNTIFLIALAEYLSCEGLPENKEKIEYYIANGEIIISSRDGIPLPKYDLISLERKNDGSMSSILTVKKIKQSELIEKMLFDGACEKMKEAKLYYEKQKGASDNGSNNHQKE